MWKAELCCRKIGRANLKKCKNCLGKQLYNSVIERLLVCLMWQVKQQYAKQKILIYCIIHLMKKKKD